MLKSSLNFFAYLTNEKGFSPHTISAYKNDCQKFIAFCLTSNITKPTELTPKILTDFFCTLHIKYASSSKYRTFVVLKSFLKFLKREGIITENPISSFPSPKKWSTVPEVLSIEEVTLLINAPSKNTIKGLKHIAILELLYGTGIRVSELCSLCLSCVNPDHIKVFGKGRKERIVPLGSKAKKALDVYLNHPKAIKGKFLFCNSNGNAITRQCVYIMIKEYASKIGITKSVSPHTLRHSYATHLMDNGADIRVIQDLLGHDSISSTEVYVHVSRKHLLDTFKKCHPKYKVHTRKGFIIAD